MADQPKHACLSWRGAILKSKNLLPTTRHILLTLSCHMNDAGESCYPTIKTLCKETGLSNRSVITHIQLAHELGWIEKEKHGFSGQKWANHQYKISWNFVSTLSEEEVNDIFGEVVNVVHNLTRKVVNEVHNVTEKMHEGSEPSSLEVVKEVHTNSSYNSSINIIEEKNKKEGSSRFPENVIPKERRSDWQKDADQPKPKKQKSQLTEFPEEGLEVTPEMVDFATDLGLSYEAIKKASSHFKDHHLSKGSKFKDWKAAWRTWMRNSVEFKSRSAR